MSLPNYGLLTGQLTAHGDQHGGNPHYLLTIQAGSIRYRVAVNLESTLGADAPPELQYQIIPNLRKGNARAKALAARIQNQNRFVLRTSASDGLDFVHDGFLDMDDFEIIPRNTSPERNAFYSALVDAAEKAVGSSDSFVAAFGTGYGGDGSSRPSRSSQGFTGVDNVHMNQGSFNEVGHHADPHYKENGPDQDGAVLFVFSDGTVQGFFSKFQSQDNETDAHGNPVRTNVAKLDDTPKSVQTALTSAIARRKKKATAMLASAKAATAARAELTAAVTKRAGKKARGKHPSPPPAPPAPPSTTPASGFIFNDAPGPRDPLHPFKTDDDSNVDKDFVDQFAKHGVPEPVPGPRGSQYPVMTFESVVGAGTVKAIQQAGKIVLHAVGDTGAPEAKKLPHELAVAKMMLNDFQGPAEGQPAFFYHLGDVVYYFGEENYYYDQFYRPYQDYPRPIFAIPGNHDGITYSDQMQSLAPFMSAFVDSEPRHWKGAGGISRTTMTQPGVFFSLDAPFVSIIGLYSNCSESYGYLDAQQTLFLYNELVRLKLKRESGEIAAILLAVHHPPMSFSVDKPSSQALRNDIDNASQKAGIWPDAVLSGHAHVYQRMTRIVPAGGGRQIPHIVCGAGGYNLSMKQEVDKADMKSEDTSDPQFRLHKFLLHYGYMKLTVTPKTSGKHGTAQFEFYSPNIVSGGAADVCTLDLQTNKLV